MDKPFSQPMSPLPGPDPTEKFLESHEELAPGSAFSFACHPGVPCFNACCGNLTLNLTPYDALLLRRGLDMCSKDFMGAFALSAAMPNGFTALRLKMLDNAQRSCPFVRAEGCSVYAHRPSSCRTYPLGRASRRGKDGMEERHFIVRESHCKGFAEAKSWTAKEWFADQGLEEFNRFNDLYATFLGRLAGVPPLGPQPGTMAFLALYQPDDFMDFCASMGVFDRLGMDEDKREALNRDEAEALKFGFAWLDMLLFKDGSGLEEFRP